MNTYVVLRDTGTGACFLSTGERVNAHDLGEAAERALALYADRFDDGDLLMVSRMGIPNVAVHRVTTKPSLGPI